MRRLLAAAACLTICLTTADVAVPGTAAADAIATPPLCGGEVVLKPDGTPWRCTFDDEFDATTGDPTALDLSKWTVQTTAASNYHTGPASAFACYMDSPNNVSVADGVLRLTAREEPQPFTCHGTNGLSATTQYTSGEVTTIGHFYQQYGRFEVRAKLPATTVKGLQETLWLWPQDDLKYGPWPSSGEIDFAEFYSQYADRDIPYIHYLYDQTTVDGATNTNIVTNPFTCTIDPGSFNDYAVVWEPGTITVSYNGKVCFTDNYVPNGGLTPPAPFDQPFFVLLTQALGINTNQFDPATTPLPATTEVDYVRVWQ